MPLQPICIPNPRESPADSFSRSPYYTAAAHQIGRRHTETISAWVSRCNRDGLAAVRPGHGGGAQIRYGADAQQRILAEWARTPQREQDGTANLFGSGTLLGSGSLGD
jgi:transposase